jgi:polysaccharide pyruvyl transferase WcaK-like protein
MYFHGGSKNHGCEAIVRATKKILNADLTLYSSIPSEDIEYGLNDVVDVCLDEEKSINKYSLDYFQAAISHKIRHDDYKYICLSHNVFFNKVKRNDICLSIGGDNYCYKGRDILGYYNKQLHQKGAKTVLWGCSFDPKDMTPEIAKDIALYDLIVTRECISYETLKAVNKNTILLPDPAFQLDVKELPLPDNFKIGHTIGINISPLIMEYGNGEIILDNYRNLLKYIIKETDDNILLIPHVVKKGNDDRTVLRLLYDEFKSTNRIILLDDYNCIQLKGYISRCRLFVGARTHATIAAYSTCVPTLVVGYSVKAIGIARELFGTDDNYVISVQNLKNQTDLIDKFRWLLNNESKIREHLNLFMPKYKTRVLKAKDLVNKL